MSLTLFSSTKVLDQVFGSTSIIASIPANWYLGLHMNNTPPVFTTPTMVEPVAMAYARQPIVNAKATPGWTATQAAGTLSNTQAITFPTATGIWGTVYYIFLADAVSGGNIWWFDALTSSKYIDNGTTVSFAANALTIQFNNS